MSYQSLLQQVDDDQRCGGNGWSTQGSCIQSSDRLKPLDGSALVQEVDGGASRSGGGGGGGGYRGSFVAPLTLNIGNRSGYCGDLTLFSPSDLFSPSPRLPLQQTSASSPFSWQSLLGGQPSVRWQPDAVLHGFATFGGDQAVVEAQVSEVNAAYVHPEEGSMRPRGDGGQNEQCRLAHEGDGVISEVDADRSGEVKAEWTNNVNSEKENWRKFGDFVAENVKQEESENIQEADHKPGDGSQSRKRYKQRRLQGHPEVEPSGSTSEFDSDSEGECGKQHKREEISRKQKRPGQDADGNITWTDDSVRFLFETYDAIHQRLWEESKGQVKYQKKWTPILKAMQARFGDHFTKKQCQSKYWSVRRECTEYRITSTKAAATDPLWNPSIAGRELLKPKFYDVWLEVSGKNQAIVPKTKSTTVKGEGYSGELLKGQSSWSLDKDGQLVKQRVKDSGSAMKEMQRLMLAQLQASEKREEAMKYRAEFMMELLTQHIEHVENRVSITDESRTPQLYLLERVNHKLENILEGFAALNQNLSMLH